MRHLVGQFFLWGFSSCLCLLLFIVVIALFDGQTDHIKFQIAIFHIYLWPFAVALGVGLRTALLQRQGEWLALQCMGWPPSKVLSASFVAGVTLAMIPFSLSMWGWESLLGLQDSAMVWVWEDQTVIRLSDGLRVSLNHEPQLTQTVRSSAELKWSSFVDCLHTPDGFLEVQHRLLRGVACFIASVVGSLAFFLRRNRWLVVGLTGLSVVPIAFSLLSPFILWGTAIILSSLLYWFGSRM